MITLNIQDHGNDDKTLECIAKSIPTAQLGELLQAYGCEVEMTGQRPEASEYEPLGKAEVFDLIKGLKIKVGAPKTNSKGKPVQKVMKRVLCYNSKTGTEYYRMMQVNADVAQDAGMSKNPLRAFDKHIAMMRTSRTEHITEYAANMDELRSTPEGQAVIAAINKAIGKGSPNGNLSENLNYTDIRYCNDPGSVFKPGDKPEKQSGCVAIAKNPNTGKDMYFYAEAYREEATAIRTQRAMALASPVVQKIVHDTLNEGEFDNEDIRDCLKLMYDYGMKSGNEGGTKKNQLGQIVTTGATTLTAGNVFIEKKQVKNPETGKTQTVEKVFLQYYQQGETGRKTHQMSQEITDPALAASLRARKEAAGSDDDRLFSCTKNNTLVACKVLFKCNNEDLRASFGVRKWYEGKRALLGNNPYAPKRTERTDPETGKKKRRTMKQAEMDIAAYMMDQMGVTDKRSVDKYMNKRVLDLFREKSKKKPPKKQGMSPSKSGGAGKKTASKKKAVK